MDTNNLKLFLKNPDLKLYIIIFFLVLINLATLVYFFKPEAVKSRSLTQAPKVQSLQTTTIAPTPFSTSVPPPTLTPTPIKTQIKTTTQKTAPSVSKITQIPGPKIPGIPVRIQIPKLGMNTTVEQVGMEANGTMSVPKSWWTVGWYNLGYKVGDSGSAVMSGHYDTNTGAPAIFYRVGSLSPGDTITVTNANGAVFQFRVYKKELYPWDQMPLQTIFNTSGRVQLNLITCSGTWDRNTQNYSHRTVIYSELIN